MKKIILTIVGMFCLVGSSWGQFWQPPQTLQFPNVGFNTPSGPYDPSAVTYTLDTSTDMTGKSLEPYEYGNSFQNVVYLGSDGSRVAFNLNMAGYSPEHNIMFFGPNMSWGVRLNSPSTGPVTDPLATSFETLANIPWNPGMSAGVTVSTPLTPEVWGASGGGGGGEEGGGGAAFVEHAQQLNVGLTFQDGQWTPIQ
jgi:hypothetical protein